MDPHGQTLLLRVPHDLGELLLGQLGLRIDLECRRLEHSGRSERAALRVTQIAFVRATIADRIERR
jgi:hypothetical protein